MSHPFNPAEDFLVLISIWACGLFSIDNLFPAAENPLTMPALDLLLARWALDIIELVLVLVVLIVSFRHRPANAKPSAFAAAEEKVSPKLAKRRTLSVIAVAALSVAARTH